MRRSRTPAPVRSVRQARRFPLHFPSRLPATSFPPTALLRRPGIGFVLSLDVGGRRFQFVRNSVTNNSVRGRQRPALDLSYSTSLTPLKSTRSSNSNVILRSTSRRVRGGKKMTGKIREAKQEQLTEPDRSHLISRQRSRVCNVLRSDWLDT